FEIIIVDDGSGAETQARLQSLPSEIRVLRQSNQGPGAARNTAFQAARAPLILPLDCDDGLEPDYLAETVPVLQSSPLDVGFVFTHLRAFGAIDRVFADRSFDRFDQLFTNKLQSCILMRKSAWERLDGYDEMMRDGYEDWDFNIRLGRAGYRGIVVPKPLYLYRVSNEGMLLSHCSGKHAGIWRYIREKHADLYRLPSVLRLWWGDRTAHRMPLPVALGILTLAQCPDRWFTAIMNLYRFGRLFKQGSREKRSATHAA
ncbi:MAG: glycosyltransferase family 2 protein, partial [Pseudorhodoplanes sp.]